MSFVLYIHTNGWILGNERGSKKPLGFSTHFFFCLFHFLISLRHFIKKNSLLIFYFTFISHLRSLILWVLLQKSLSHAPYFAIFHLFLLSPSPTLYVTIPLSFLFSPFLMLYISISFTIFEFFSKSFLSLVTLTHVHTCDQWHHIMLKEVVCQMNPLQTLT